LLLVLAVLGGNYDINDRHTYVELFFDLREVCGVSMGLSVEARIELDHTGHSVKNQFSPFHNGFQRVLQRF